MRRRLLLAAMLLTIVAGCGAGGGCQHEKTAAPTSNMPDINDLFDQKYGQRATGPRAGQGDINQLIRERYGQAQAPRPPAPNISQEQARRAYYGIPAPIGRTAEPEGRSSTSYSVPALPAPEPLAWEPAPFFRHEIPTPAFEPFDWKQRRRDREEEDHRWKVERQLEELSDRLEDQERRDRWERLTGEPALF